MGKPDGWVGSDLRSRAEVVQWLTLQGGEAHDASGLLVGRMRSDLKKGRALSQLVADMDREGMIEREVRGRRTYRIKLLDDWGLLEEARNTQAVIVTNPMSTVNGEVDYDVLAETLLARVIQQAHTVPSQGAEVERLREQVAELKAQAKELGASLVIARAEVEDARKAAETLRKNWEKREKEYNAPRTVKLRETLSEKDRALLDRLMRQAPGSSK